MESATYLYNKIPLEDYLKGSFDSSESGRDGELNKPRTLDEDEYIPEEYPRAIVFFDLETGGFYNTDDILQIAMMCGNKVFNRYASPTKCISPDATSVHGLTSNGSNLYRRGKLVKSSPLRLVLQKMLYFLRNRGKPCVLVAHNCNFDSTRLLFKIKEFSLIKEFRQVVVGFTDTLSLFKERFPHRKGKGAFKLTTLAKDLLQLSSEEVDAGAHDAMHDVKMLENLSFEYFEYEDLDGRVKSYDSLVESMHKKESSATCLRSLEPLAIKRVVSKGMLERMARAGITHESLTGAFFKSEQHLINLLEQRVEGKAQVIKSKKILNNIIDYLKDYFDVCDESEF